MNLIPGTKALFGLGAVAALALAGPIAASAAPGGSSIPSIGQHTEGCAYEVTANHVHMYKTPGGTANRTTLRKGEIVSSAPRTVVSGPHGTQWVFVIQDSVPIAPVGFVNKTFLHAVSCRTPASS
jgi:hypothetical protein